MNIESVSRYASSSNSSLENARLVLKEVEEWQETLYSTVNFMNRDKTTKHVYDVLSAVGGDRSQIEKIRIKQLVRERIRILELNTKPIDWKMKINNFNDQKEGKVSRFPKKGVPTPLPRVAFLTKRKDTPHQKAVVFNQDFKVPVSKANNTCNRQPTRPSHLSQLLEIPRKVPSITIHSHPPLPFSQYFHPSIPSSKSIMSAVPVFPPCQILERTPEQKIKPAIKVSKTREDRIAVINVESRRRDKRTKDKLQVQVLPSCSIESTVRGKNKKPNIQLITCYSKEEQNGLLTKSDSPIIPTAVCTTPNPDVTETDKSVRTLEMVDVATSPNNLTRLDSKPVSEMAVQTNGGNIFQPDVGEDQLKHLVLQVLEENLMEKLKTVQIKAEEPVPQPQEVIQKRTLDSNTQTNFTSHYVDEATSFSEAEVTKELRDVEVWTSVSTSNVEVQVDKILRTSVALSPIQELRRNIYKNQEVEVKPQLTDCATSPLVVQEQEAPPDSSDGLSTTPKSKRLPSRQPKLQESSSSSYLTDTTSTTTTTTRTTSSEEQISEGELVFRKTKRTVGAMPCLSEGEITPDIIYSVSKDELNSSRSLSEGQFPDLNSTAQSQFTGRNETSDGDATALQSTGEISLMALSTELST